MKKLLLALSIVLFAAAPVFAASIAWDVPATGGAPDGYLVYYSDGTNNYSKDVGNVLIYDMAGLNLVPGTAYTLDVTAYNIAGESGHSAAVNYTPPPFVPTDNPAPVVINIPGSPVTININ